MNTASSQATVSCPPAYIIPLYTGSQILDDQRFPDGGPFPNKAGRPARPAVHGLTYMNIVMNLCLHWQCYPVGNRDRLLCAGGLM